MGSQGRISKAKTKKRLSPTGSGSKKESGNKEGTKSDDRDGKVKRIQKIKDFFKRRREGDKVDKETTTGKPKVRVALEPIVKTVDNIETDAEIKSEKSENQNVVNNEVVNNNNVEVVSEKVPPVSVNNNININGDPIPELNGRAKSRHEHLTRERPEKEVYFKGRLYEEAVWKLRNGHFRIKGDVHAGKVIEEYVTKNLAKTMAKEGHVFENEELTSDNKKYYYSVKYMYYFEAIDKLKNGEFTSIGRHDEIAKAIEDFVDKKILSYIK